MTQIHFCNLLGPASWSSVDAFVSGARDLRLNSRADQIGHIVLSMARHRCNNSLEGAALFGHSDAEMANFLPASV